MSLPGSLVNSISRENLDLLLNPEPGDLAADIGWEGKGNPMAPLHAAARLTPNL
jgi:hypothetical protein